MLLTCPHYHLLLFTKKLAVNIPAGCLRKLCERQRRNIKVGNFIKNLIGSTDHFRTFYDSISLFWTT